MSARSWTMRVRRSVTDTISTTNPGSISTARPGFNFPPGETIASYRSPPIGERRKISARAPEPNRRPRSRARTTRERLTTSRSFGSRMFGSSVNR
jgi:hypothetical protein